MTSMKHALRLAILTTLLALASVIVSAESLDFIWAPIITGGLACWCWTRFQGARLRVLDDRKWFQGVGLED